MSIATEVESACKMHNLTEHMEQTVRGFRLWSDLFLFCPIAGGKAITE